MVLYVTVTWRSWGGVNVALFIWWECEISAYPNVSTLPDRGVNKSRATFRARAALAFQGTAVLLAKPI